MSLSSARTWLPESAFLSPSTIAPLAECVASWSGQWLAEGEFAPQDGWRKLFGPLPETRLTVGEGCSILCIAESRFELASLLLGCEVSSRRLRTAQDRAVVDQLVDEALASLGDALHQVLPAATGVDEGPYYALDFGLENGHPVAAILYSRSRLIELARSQVGSARAKPPFAALATAITDHGVNLGARLGNCRLSLAEIEALAVGDIIVLDEPTSSPLDLLIAGGDVARGAAMLAVADRNLNLVIERSSDKW